MPVLSCRRSEDVLIHMPHTRFRPGEGVAQAGTPYAVSPRCGNAYEESTVRWLWVRAFVGTRAEFNHHAVTFLISPVRLAALTPAVHVFTTRRASLLRADGLLQHLLDHRTDLADALENPLDFRG